MYRIFFFLLFLAFSSVSPENQICKKIFKILILPVFFDLKAEKHQELLYLQEGISEILFSYLRTNYWIRKKITPALTFRFTKERFFECGDQILEFQLFKEIKEISLKPKTSKMDIFFDLAIQYQADGIVSGFMETKKESLEIEWIYIDAWDRKNSFSKLITLDIKNPYSEENQKKIFDVAQYLTKEALKENRLKINIQSDIQEYFVYVNSLTYGKNTKEILLPHEDFEISIYSEFCHKTYSLKDQKKKMIEYHCDDVKYSEILIKTHQPDVDVFFDERYMGKTPLVVKIPKKIYRLRLSKEGFLDTNAILDLNQSKNEYFFTLREGNNQEFYYAPRTVIGDWDYYDLSLGFALQSLIFAGGWVYYNIQKEKVLDSIRSPQIPNYYEFEKWGLSEFYKIETARKKSFEYFQRAQTSATLGIGSLLFSFGFLYLGIRNDEERSYLLGQSGFGIQWKF
ncbi:MAG: PEGA domain-containing protein [Leptospiraceae bacterium]|nr:PEGA domain-containing protein [Leptospiraceae bacterium]MDW7975641.1 PEGA domain-containing protein [Leptospiraceae bacterium]